MRKTTICLGVICILLILSGCKDPRFVEGTPEYKKQQDLNAYYNARRVREAAGNYTGYPVGSAKYKERMTPEYVASRKKRDAANKALQQAQVHSRTVASRQQADYTQQQQNQQAANSRTATNYKSRMSNNDITSGLGSKSFKPNSRTGNSNTYMGTKVGNDLYHVQELGTSSNYGPGDFKAVTF